VATIRRVDRGALLHFLGRSNQPQRAFREPDGACNVFLDPVDMWGSLRGHHAESFKGKLFVGQDELADMHGGRFMTVSFVPGPYEFTATTWMADGPGGGGHLKLDLTAHHHYYIELRDRDSFPMTKMFGIKQVACEEAARNNSKDKPIDSSARRIIANGSFIAEVAFPICPETD
jgi:hypothetical protein